MKILPLWVLLCVNVSVVYQLVLCLYMGALTESEIVSDGWVRPPRRRRILALGMREFCNFMSFHFGGSRSANTSSGSGIRCRKWVSSVFCLFSIHFHDGTAALRQRRPFVIRNVSGFLVYEVIKVFGESCCDSAIDLII